MSISVNEIITSRMALGFDEHFLKLFTLLCPIKSLIHEFSILKFCIFRPSNQNEWAIEPSSFYLDFYESLIESFSFFTDDIVPPELGNFKDFRRGGISNVKTHVISEFYKLSPWLSVNLDSTSYLSTIRSFHRSLQSCEFSDLSISNYNRKYLFPDYKLFSPRSASNQNERISYDIKHLCYNNLPVEIIANDLNTLIANDHNFYEAVNRVCLDSFVDAKHTVLSQQVKPMGSAWEDDIAMAPFNIFSLFYKSFKKSNLKTIEIELLIHQSFDKLKLFYPNVSIDFSRTPLNKEDFIKIVSLPRLYTDVSKGIDDGTYKVNDESSISLFDNNFLDAHARLLFSFPGLTNFKSNAFDCSDDTWSALNRLMSFLDEKPLPDKRLFPTLSHHLVPYNECKTSIANCVHSAMLDASTPLSSIVDKCSKFINKNFVESNYCTEAESLSLDSWFMIRHSMLSHDDHLILRVRSLLIDINHSSSELLIASTIPQIRNDEISKIVDTFLQKIADAILIQQKSLVSIEKLKTVYANLEEKSRYSIDRAFTELAKDSWLWFFESSHFANFVSERWSSISKLQIVMNLKTRIYDLYSQRNFAIEKGCLNWISEIDKFSYFFGDLLVDDLIFYKNLKKINNISFEEQSTTTAYIILDTLVLKLIEQCEETSKARIGSKLRDAQKKALNLNESYSNQLGIALAPIVINSFESPFIYQEFQVAQNDVISHLGGVRQHLEIINSFLKGKFDFFLPAEIYSVIRSSFKAGYAPIHKISRLEQIQMCERKYFFQRHITEILLSSGARSAAERQLKKSLDSLATKSNKCPDIPGLTDFTLPTSIGSYIIREWYYRTIFENIQADASELQTVVTTRSYQLLSAFDSFLLPQEIQFVKFSLTKFSSSSKSLIKVFQTLICICEHHVVLQTKITALQEIISKCELRVQPLFSDPPGYPPWDERSLSDPTYEEVEERQTQEKQRRNEKNNSSDPVDIQMKNTILLMVAFCTIGIIFVLFTFLYHKWTAHPRSSNEPDADDEDNPSELFGSRFEISEQFLPSDENSHSSDRNHLDDNNSNYRDNKTSRLDSSSESSEGVFNFEKMKKKVVRKGWL